MKKNKKSSFGMLSVKAGIDNNPNPTQADRIAGAKMKDKKQKANLGKFINEKKAERNFKKELKKGKVDIKGDKGGKKLSTYVMEKRNEPKIPEFLKRQKNAPTVDKDSFDFQKKVKAAKKAIAEYPEKMKKRDRMIMRQYKKDDLALRKVYRAAGRAVPFVSKALGAIGSLIPTRAGSAELKDMEKKKYGGPVGVKMAKGGFKKKTPIY